MNWAKTYAMPLAVVVAVLSCGSTTPARADATPAIQFVSEYIRGLVAFERIRSLPAKDDKDQKNHSIEGCIRNGAGMVTQLRAQLRLLRNMRLAIPFDDLVIKVVDLLEQKATAHQKLVDICAAIMAGPKENVDYGALAAEMPRITAQLAVLDKSLFETTPAVFATLVDPRQDSQHRASHLVITKSERQWLLTTLASGFGDRLDQKHPDYIISAAADLKTSLLADYKCSDEPWD